MNETRVFMPEGNSGTNDFLLGSMMANGGIGGMNGMWNNPIWAIVFLAALRNNGIFGNDGNGNNSQIAAIQEQLNTIQGQNALMSAIQGGTNETRQLANTLNCDINAVQSGINAVQSAICGVGNQVGMSSQAIINAVNSGDNAIANQLTQCCCGLESKITDCCCTVKDAITQQGFNAQLSNERQTNLLQQNFAQQSYNLAQQFCDLKTNNDANTRAVLAKMDAIEDARKDREISALQAQLVEARSDAKRKAELDPITRELYEIKCRQPQTRTIPADNGLYLDSCALSTLRLRELALAAGYTLTPATAAATA